MNDTTLFAFESDFVAKLRCIPMAVRFKLDHCGIKLSLRQWSRFTPSDRRDLLMAPCDTADETDAYRRHLRTLVLSRTGGEATALPDPVELVWRRVDATPDAVRLFALSVNAPPPDASQWRALGDLQRFTLLKLSRDNHDNVNFAPALREFGLPDRIGLPLSADAPGGTANRHASSL